MDPIQGQGVVFSQSRRPAAESAHPSQGHDAKDLALSLPNQLPADDSLQAIWYDPSYKEHLDEKYLLMHRQRFYLQ